MSRPLLKGLPVLAACSSLAGCDGGVGGGAADLLGTGLALVVVLTLAYVSIWILRRLQTAQTGSEELRFLRAVPVGARERIVMVAWRGEVLLLGVTPGAVTLLDRAPGPAEPEASTLDRVGPMSMQRDVDRLRGWIVGTFGSRAPRAKTAEPASVEPPRT